MDAFFIGIAEALGYDADEFYFVLCYVSMFLTLLTWFRFPITMFIGFALMYAGFYIVGFIFVALTIFVYGLLIFGWWYDKYGD